MNKKSIIALVLAMVMMMSLLAGCSNGGSKVDSTKTHLSVLCYDGGIGSEWAKNAAKRFEEKYANVSFAPFRIGFDNKRKAIGITSHTNPSFDKIP